MNKSIVIALIIAVVATLWILSGVKNDAEKPVSQQTVSQVEEPAAELEQKKIPEVRVQNLIAQIMEDDVEVTGRTQASRQVIIRAETEGKIASLQVNKGDVVKKGQLLAKVDVGDRAARVEEARQILKQRKIQYDASKKLTEKGYNSRVRLAETESNLQSARAQLTQAQEELSNIVIKAPFGGVINDQMVEVGDYVSNGSELLEIVDLNPIEISGFLTEKQIGSLHQGDEANAILLNGEKIAGKVSFIAAAADLETRTFSMELTVPNEDYSIKEGLTAKILVPFKENKAYKISPSILSLADDGTVGIKLVNSNNVVEFQAVTLLKDTPDYLWVGGLPDNIQVITVGQEFVIPGQEVKPIFSEGQSFL